MIHTSRPIMSLPGWHLWKDNTKVWIVWLWWQYPLCDGRAISFQVPLGCVETLHIIIIIPFFFFFNQHGAEKRLPVAAFHTFTWSSWSSLVSYITSSYLQRVFFMVTWQRKLGGGQAVLHEEQHPPFAIHQHPKCVEKKYQVLPYCSY